MKTPSPPPFLQEIGPVLAQPHGGGRTGLHSVLQHVSAHHVWKSIPVHQIVPSQAALATTFVFPNFSPERLEL